MFILKSDVINMKILVTGAFGNIGEKTLNLLISRKYKVSTFDLKTKQNQKTAQKYYDHLNDFFWGDICNIDDLRLAIKDQDIIIHLAAIIPPVSEKKPKLAYKINVEGTRNILNVIKEVNPNVKLIFSSSVSVHGDRQDLIPPVNVNSKIKPSDHYSRHKIQCEEMIKKTEIDWTILRLGAVPYINLKSFDPVMFDISLNSRIEFVHGDDVAIALSNCSEMIFSSDKSVLHKTFLIGGGKENGCQLYYRDFIEGILDSFGIRPLPDKAFGKNPFYTDWMDTTESQEILHYQNHSFKFFTNKIKIMWGIRRWFVKMFFLVSRSVLLRKSKYWNNNWKLY